MTTIIQSEFCHRHLFMKRLLTKSRVIHFHTNEHSHSLCISVYTWLGELKDWNFSINYSCDLEFSDRRIRYLSTTNHNNHRTNLFPAFYLGNSLYKHYLTGDDSRKIKETNWDLNISGSPIRVSLLDAIDYINTSNPFIYNHGQSRHSRFL